jgi:hypothetical protein
MIELSHTEQVIAVIPENSNGPGWQNSVIWIHIVNTINNKWRCERLQPEQITSRMWVMFDTLEKAHDTMKGLVNESTLQNKS